LFKKAQAVVQKISRKNVTSSVLIFSSFLSFDGGHGWKNHNQLKRTALKKAHRKRARNALSKERTLELRQWCTTSRECSVRLDKGRKSESS